jgi:thioredoxin-related protein
LAVLTAVLMLASAGLAAATGLSPARDLQADGDAARRARLPVVLFFHSETCPYCRQIEELYLPTLLEENARTPRFLIRTVEIDSSLPLKDFRGELTEMRRFARDQGVRLVPHLRFVGPDGEPLAPDLIGLNPPDFYYGYLDGSIQQAFDRLRQPVR